MNSHGQFIDMHMAWEKFPFVMLGILDTKWKNFNNDAFAKMGEIPSPVHSPKIQTEI